MPNVGDRVIIEGAKIGQQRREGSLLGITGRLLNVRWSDGTTSLLTPGAGSVTFLPKSAGGRGGAARPTGKKPVVKGSAKGARTGAGAKSAKVTPVKSTKATAAKSAKAATTGSKRPAAKKRKKK